MSIPIVVTVSSPDKLKISKVEGWSNTNLTFFVDEDFVEYKICVVAEPGDIHSEGVTIPSDGGSINVSGIGSFPINTNITSTINGTDLETASSGDGVKYIKVFVKGTTGNWSV
jgi:hypothetical protein